MRAILDWLLPRTCLLCGAAGDDDLDLCAACRCDLPWLTAACPRCAEPLPVAALCGPCQLHPPPFRAATMPLRYEAEVERLVQSFKFHRQLAAGRTLALLLAAHLERTAVPLPEALLPVPLNRRRLYRRGYNQAALIARILSRRFRLPVVTGGLHRTRATTPQSELAKSARRQNVKGAFACRSGTHLPRHVALIDDVVTTGATVAECARVLKRAGVKHIQVWALARTP